MDCNTRAVSDKIDLFSTMNITAECHQVNIIVPETGIALLLTFWSTDEVKNFEGVLTLPKGTHKLCMCNLVVCKYKVRFLTFRGPLVPQAPPPQEHKVHKSLGTLVLPGTAVSSLRDLIFNTWYVQGIAQGRVLCTGTPKLSLAEYTHIRKVTMVLYNRYRSPEIWTCNCPVYLDVYDEIRWSHPSPLAE